MKKEEFERIKEAEKKRLRLQKRLREIKRTSERQQTSASLVRKMQSASASLLRDTQSLLDSLSAEVAKSQARLEVAMDEEADAPSSTASDDDIAAFEREQSVADREARARDLVRQFKESVQPSRSSEDAAEDADTTDPSPEPNEGEDDLPDKTIGRMRDT